MIKACCVKDAIRSRSLKNSLAYEAASRQLTSRWKLHEVLVRSHRCLAKTMFNIIEIWNYFVCLPMELRPIMSIAPSHCLKMAGSISMPFGRGSLIFIFISPQQNQRPSCYRSGAINPILWQWVTRGAYRIAYCSTHTKCSKRNKVRCHLTECQYSIRLSACYLSDTCEN